MRFNSYDVDARWWQGVQPFIDRALAERRARWQAPTRWESLAHKQRGRYWHRCARWNAQYAGASLDDVSAYIQRGYLKIDRAKP